MKFDDLNDEEDSTFPSPPQPLEMRDKRYSAKFLFLIIPLALLFLFCAATTIQHYQEKPIVQADATIKVEHPQEKPTTQPSSNPVEKPVVLPPVESTGGNSPKSTDKPTESAPGSSSGEKGTNTPEQPVQVTPSGEKERPLVLYSYFEKPALRENAEFFLKHGLYAGADFILIINGDTDIDNNIPKWANNIKVIRRENKCFDLGAMGEVLLANDSELLKKYKKFILMNATIRGPFLPRWAKDCWTDTFLNRITNEVKLVGMTHNCWPTRHVQSMIVATDDVGIRVLLQGTITQAEANFNRDAFYPNSLAGLNYCPETYGRAVSTEISLTNLMHRVNYKVDVLMTSAARKGYFDNICDHNDPTIASLYFGYAIHPYETVFVKVNKHEYDAVVVNKLTEWHNDWNYTSWEACKA